MTPYYNKNGSKDNKLGFNYNKNGFKGNKFGCLTLTKMVLKVTNLVLIITKMVLKVTNLVA
ncbi:hypothetical protein BK732_13670 [Bacillus thuringiensis serovar navarrensis]|uniref:Uncharacterized protein n=1 Tax=Bacillus thuringiensis serovar navarrensis TaxID=339658 RepID=A0A243AEI1_BACTU|nr:hypothetical protein BK732_13670 [Bacillus thuringiensis serovar navarrensis]